MQDCIIEIPKNSYVKYEIDNDKLLVDRILSTPIPFHLTMVTYQIHLQETVIH